MADNTRFLKIATDEKVTLAIDMASFEEITVHWANGQTVQCEKARCILCKGKDKPRTRWLGQVTQIPDDRDIDPEQYTWDIPNSLHETLAGLSEELGDNFKCNVMKKGEGLLTKWTVIPIANLPKARSKKEEEVRPEQHKKEKEQDRIEEILDVLVDIQGQLTELVAAYKQGMEGD